MEEPKDLIELMSKLISHLNKDTGKLFFILDEDRKPVNAETPFIWKSWMDIEANRTVRETEIGPVTISTVFMGVNAKPDASVPILFQTLVMGGRLNKESTTCATWEEAEKMHEDMLQRLKTSALDA